MDGLEVAAKYLRAPEQVTSAAFRHKPTGRVVNSGMIHDLNVIPGMKQIMSMKDPNSRLAAQQFWKLDSLWEAGFKTTRGRFVTRNEAKDLLPKYLDLVDTDEIWSATGIKGP